MQPTISTTPARTNPSRLTSLGQSLLVAVVLAACLQPSTVLGQDFTIDFRALGGSQNPHPPIPQCQVVEMDDPPYPDTTGDCLHGNSTSNGQPIECLLAGGGEDCPVLTIGVPSPGILFATTEGIGVVDYDTEEPGACPLHCSPNWLLGDDCGTIPGDPCFCDANGCVGTPTFHGDWKDGLDYTHESEPSGEEIRIYFGVPALISELAFWRAGSSELSIERSDCPGALRINYREADQGAQAGDGEFTSPGGGYFLPQNAVLTLSNPDYRPFSTNDRIALQEFGVTTVSSDQERWRTSCPYFAVPFDRGFTTLTNDQWQRVDDDTNPAVDVWTNTSNVSTSHCDLPNLTGGAAGAVCFQSPPGHTGFDTSLISRSIDLSAAAHPILRFVVSFQCDDERLDISTSTDGGATWDLRTSLDQSQPDGTAVEVPLEDLGHAPDVQLRFRYHDPNGTDSSIDHVVVDDILIYSDDQLFADGFESGTLGAWL